MKKDNSKKDDKKVSKTVKTADKAAKKQAKHDKKCVEVIDQGGAKTVKKKTSYVTWVKRITAVISVVWLVAVFWFPLHVKNTYSEPIKKSIVVSMFFDLQRSISKQYEQMLQGIKKSVNIEKPIAAAIDHVKMVDGTVNKVYDVTDGAKGVTGDAKEATSNAKKTTGLLGKFGVKTDGLDKAIEQTDKVIREADKAIADVDNTAKMVNQKLDEVEQELVRVSKTELDKMVDEAIKSQLDKNMGGLGTTLLTNYGVRHVYPWRKSTWPVSTKIYNDLEKADLSTTQILTNTVNTYFGYVAWGLVAFAWVIGLIIWFMVMKKVKLMLAPFIVCPRCGHTFVTKKSAMNFLRIFQPWQWF